MKISTTGINLIKKFEGCVLHAYKDPVGVWTIGYGHTLGVKEGQWITQKQADTFLKNDCVIYENGVKNTKITLNQHQFDALVSFAYNCGVGNLNTLVDGRTLNEISKALLLYNKAGGNVLQGLVNRRKAEKALFDKGVVVKKTVASKVRTLLLSTPQMHGEDVLDLQKRLIKLNFFPDIKKANKGADGYFGKNTNDAYRRWQSVYIPKVVDGKHGSNGRKILNGLTDKLM